MLEFSSFIKYVKRNLTDYLPEKYDGYDINLLSDFTKKNPKEDGVILRKGSEVDPLLMLTPFYTVYRSGKSMEEVMKAIADVYENINRIEAMFAPENILYETVRNHIFPQVQERGLCTENIKNIPHKLKDGFVISYFIHFKHADGAYIKVQITNEHLKHWRMDEERVTEKAWANMYRQLPPVFQKLEEYVKQEEHPVTGFAEKVEDKKMYMLTSSHGLNGAVYLFEKKFMERISDITGDDIIVLPKSVNGVLLLKKRNSYALEAFEETLEAMNLINRNQGERLAEHIYVYEYESQKLVQAKDWQQEQGMTLEM